VRISRLGSTPDSDSLFAFTITMTRMTRLLHRLNWVLSRLYGYDERGR
jgi:hypothetical protein